MNNSMVRSASVSAWLLLMIFMVFSMVVVGGVTRLTGSGLSIVEWAPIMGAVPPLNETDWQQAFLQYQQYPQYRISNPGMTLADFKGIFFWEYLHRLLGRSIGLVFMLPFLWFWLRGQFTRSFTFKALVALGLGAMQGVMGWLMVKSGLVDEPRVSHYRLAAHLGLALLIMSYLWWLHLDLRYEHRSSAGDWTSRGMLWLIGVLTVVQIIYGAFVAGLRAGWGYNTFPRMGDRWIAEAVGALAPWWHNLVESHATVQFIHRWLGTLLLVAVIGMWLRARHASMTAAQRSSVQWLLLLMLAQYLLGVYTLLGVVPLVPAVMHQGCAALLLLAIVQLFYHNAPDRTHQSRAA